MWTAWENGDIDVAQRLAEEALASGRASDEAHHVLCLTAFVRGDYRVDRQPSRPPDSQSTAAASYSVRAPRRLPATDEPRPQGAKYARHLLSWPP